MSKNDISFIKTTLLGGFTVLLPIAILATVFNWLYSLITGALEPLTKTIWGQAVLVTHVITALIIIIISFLLGVAIKTALGKYIYETIEKELLCKIPGYNTTKDIVFQFLGKKKNSFSSVALVNLFNNETMVTAFITDEHNNGITTIFMPTGPNPTSGNIYHVKSSNVHKVDIPIEEAMRSIISCGAGSTNIMKNLTRR